MIPRLFDEVTTSYTGMGIVSIPDVYNCYVREVLNGEFELEFDYPLTSNGVEEVLVDRQVVVKPNLQATYDHPFRIKEVVKNSKTNSLHVYGISHTNDLLGYSVSHLKLTNIAASQIASRLEDAMDMECKIKIHTSVYNVGNINGEWYCTNPLDILMGDDGSLLDLTGGDVLRSVNQLSIIARKGTDLSNIVFLDNNVAGVTLTLSNDEFYSHLKGYVIYKGEDDKEEQYIITSPVIAPWWVSSKAQINVKILDFSNEFKDASWAPTVSQVTTVVRNYLSSARGSRRNRKMFEVAIDIMSLRNQQGYSEINNTLEKVGLGDSFKFVYRPFGLNQTVRVTELTYDVINERNTQIKVENYNPS